MRERLRSIWWWACPALAVLGVVAAVGLVVLDLRSRMVTDYFALTYLGPARGEPLVHQRWALSAQTGAGNIKLGVTRGQSPAVVFT